MLLKRALLCLFLLTGLFFSTLNRTLAQPESNISTLKPWQLKNVGKNAVRLGDIYSAITYYERYCELKPQNYDVAYTLAELYRQARDYKKAETAYLKCYTGEPESHVKALYYYALMQKMNGNYIKSKESFLKFSKEYAKNKDKDNKFFKKMAKNEIAGCDIAKGLIDKPLQLALTHLDTSINKAHVEFAPFPLNDSTLLYASLRADSIEHFAQGDSVKRPVRQFYLAKKTGNTWKGGTSFPGAFNIETEQTGNGTYSPDGKRFYFNRCAFNWQSKMICAIYVSQLEKGIWTEPVKLDESINDPKFSSTQPAVGVESKNNFEVLYFISDRPKGKGGTDIWYSVYNSRKKVYGPPKNAGGKINTIGNEYTPFYNIETHAIYFSSDGWPGIGGLDVFKCTGELNNWSVPENTGVPINSSVDDIYYVVNKNQEGGFWVSNREGGIALKSATCCDDIYSFKLTKYIHLAAAGKVIEIPDSGSVKFIDSYASAGKKDSSGAAPLAENEQSKLAKGLAKSPVSLYLVDKNNEEILIKTDTTDINGDYFFKLEQGNEYRIVVNSKGYFNKKIPVSTKNIDASDTLRNAIRISKIPKGPVVVKNIYYPFDKYYLTDAAKLTIDTTLFTLLTENPEIIIELSSHTDSKGTDAYNQKLSQNRAESVVAYLITKGIAKERLVAKGYGESKPIALNSNPDGTDNPDGRQMNRRTEFKVIGIIEKYSEIIYQD